MKLRPHHLLCMQKYTGNGYDQRFSAHMEALLQQLMADPSTVIELTEGKDDVCAACPHMGEKGCDSQDKVARFDAGVLRACGLGFGETKSWDALASAARNKILDTERFQQICADCQWFALCQRTQAGWIDGKAN